MIRRAPSRDIPVSHASRMLSLRRGFTVLELMIVVIVAGIFAGLSASKIAEYMTKQRVSKAALSVTNDVQQAFAIAGRNRRPIRLYMDTTRMQLMITDRAKTTIFRRNTLGSAYSLKSSNVSFYPTAGVEIFPNGLASDTMWVRFRSVVRRDTTSRYLRVSRAGMVQVLSK